jgi:IS5 family transposase
MASFFAFTAESRVGNKNVLVRLNNIIDWEKFKSCLKGIHKNDIYSKGGPKCYDHVKMFKALLLGQWHNLSDAALEEGLKVRLDFMIFTGFELSDTLPDETTICRFRNKLIEKGLYKVLLKEINKQLEEHGLKVEEAKGAVIDATIIESASRPRKILEPIAKDREEKSQDNYYRVKDSVDPDAKWLKKAKRSYFGYKGFLVTEAKEGFIEKVKVTPANISEMQCLGSLTHKLKAKRVFTDKGYTSRQNRELLKEKGYKDGIMSRAKKGKPLSYWEKVRNRLISKQRFIVEQAFGTLKRKFFFQRASYKSTKKVEAQLAWKAICFNLLKASRKVAVI